jgi:predicted nucleic acid-binding Zn ribbon protein
MIGNELCSAAVGESEHQVSDEAQALVAALEPDVQAAVAELAGLRGDVLYVGDDYTRWVLTLDVDSVEALLTPNAE